VEAIFLAFSLEHRDAVLGNRALSEHPTFDNLQDSDDCVSSAAAMLNEGNRLRKQVSRIASHRCSTDGHRRDSQAAEEDSQAAEAPEAGPELRQRRLSQPYETGSQEVASICEAAEGKGFGSQEGSAECCDRGLGADAGVERHDWRSEVLALRSEP
jgi:hypothetical protein